MPPGDYKILKIMKSIYLMAAGLLVAQAVRLDSSAQEKLYTYMQQEEQPPADVTFVQGNPYKPRRIYDEDGDGVHDDTPMTPEDAPMKHDPISVVDVDKPTVENRRRE